jgi:hypothetical protein
MNVNHFPDIAPILLHAVAKQIVDERREQVQLWGKSSLPETMDRCIALAAERIRAMVAPTPVPEPSPVFEEVADIKRKPGRPKKVAD